MGTRWRAAHVNGVSVMSGVVEAGSARVGGAEAWERVGSRAGERRSVQSKHFAVWVLKIGAGAGYPILDTACSENPTLKPAYAPTSYCRIIFIPLKDRSMT